jgi:hypothetical protein
MKINSIKAFSHLEQFELWRSQWGKKDQVDIYSYISCMCNPEHSLLFCRILFPDFIVVDGAVFLDFKYDDNIFNVWLERLGGDLCATEKMMNLTHVYDIFSGGDIRISDSDSVFEPISSAIAFSWRLVLRNKFPDKVFCVRESNSDQEYGPTITFYQGVEQV